MLISCAQLQVTPPIVSNPEPKWYVIHTRARHEKKVVAQLAEQRIVSFTPTVWRIHQWSDRCKPVELPLFSCYVFVQVENWRDINLHVLRLPGVLQWVRLNKEEPAVVPDTQIDAVRAVLASRLPFFEYPYLRVGQKVRLRSGCLDGVEGVLLERKGDRTLVVSIHLIKQSVAIFVEGYQVEAA
jgi:transcription antitermination factor NusG